MNDYEAIRLRNLEDNRRVLASFGLLNPFKSLPCVIKDSRKPNTPRSQPKKRPAPSVSDNSEFIGGSVYGTRRKSARLEGKEVAADSLQDSVVEDDEESRNFIKVPANRPNFYGAVPGIEVGTVWMTRMECCRDGVHRPTVAGIHGGESGAYSIALSGGYEDDVDLGDCFTYTGEGGRDLKGTKTNPKNLRTAPQSKAQTLTRGNLALSRNVDTGNPVRVIRGYKLHSPFAPEDGYRYDGLYTVEKCWFTIGLSGFGVWKFALKRCADQAPPPWHFSSEPSSPAKSTASTDENENVPSLPVKSTVSTEGEEDTLESPGKTVVPNEKQDMPNSPAKSTESSDENQDIPDSQSSTESDVVKGRSED